MRTFTHQMMRVALTGVVALSGVSSAFALSLDGDFLPTKLPKKDIFMKLDVAAHADAKTTARCTPYTGEELKRCEAIIEQRAEVKGSAKADIETHGKFVRELPKKDEEKQNAIVVARMETRVIAMLRNSFITAAKLVRHACNSTLSDATLVSQCVATSKAHIQAQLTAMIDAAFSTN